MALSNRPRLKANPADVVAKALKPIPVRICALPMSQAIGYDKDFRAGVKCGEGFGFAVLVSAHDPIRSALRFSGEYNGIKRSKVGQYLEAPLSAPTTASVAAMRRMLDRNANGNAVSR